MPEFILDHGSPEAAIKYNALDEFTQGYIEAMFFTSTGQLEDEELENASVAELAPGTWQKIIDDCQRFQTGNAEDLDEATDNGRINGYDLKAAGRDFWYDRTGSGVGFSDRNLGDVGEKLSTIAVRVGHIALYRGDDGLLYLS
jgi:hypothetical protein